MHPFLLFCRSTIQPVTIVKRIIPLILFCFVVTECSNSSGNNKPVAKTKDPSNTDFAFRPLSAEEKTNYSDEIKNYYTGKYASRGFNGSFLVANPTKKDVEWNNSLYRSFQLENLFERNAIMLFVF